MPLTYAQVTVAPVAMQAPGVTPKSAEGLNVQRAVLAGVTIASVAVATGTGLLGLVTSMICTALSNHDVTQASTLAPFVKTATPFAPSSASKPLEPSFADPTATGDARSDKSISCTPSSSYDATIAYHVPPTSNVATSLAPSSISNPSTPSVANPFATGNAGFVISMICTPSSFFDATIAYTLLPITNVLTPVGPESSMKLLVDDVQVSAVTIVSGVPSLSTSEYVPLTYAQVAVAPVAVQAPGVTPKSAEGLSVQVSRVWKVASVAVATGTGLLG